MIKRIQFINGIDYEMMTGKIIKNKTTMGKISDITYEQVFMLAKRVEAQRK